MVPSYIVMEKLFSKSAFVISCKNKNWPWIGNRKLLFKWYPHCWFLQSFNKRSVTSSTQDEILFNWNKISRKWNELSMDQELTLLIRLFPFNIYNSKGPNIGDSKNQVKILTRIPVMWGAIIETMIIIILRNSIQIARKKTFHF